MKRSEMLDHIKEDLLEKLKHRWFERGETDKWAEFTANELLEMIEGFGMRPPFFQDDVNWIASFKWEKEDEKK